MLCWVQKKIVYFFYSHEYHTFIRGETKTHVTVKGLVSNNMLKSQVQIQKKEEPSGERVIREEFMVFTYHIILHA